jgi:hypothetical protein
MFTEKIEIFWTNIASTMAYPNFKNGPKIGLCHLGINNIRGASHYRLQSRKQRIPTI